MTAAAISPAIKGPAGWTDRSFPVMLDLSSRRVLLVGGGATSEDKVRLLVAAGADITVVSPTVTLGLRRLIEADAISWHRRRFHYSDLDGVMFVVAATDDSEVNHLVFDAAEANGTLCNAVDDTANCSAILPSVHRDGPLVVAVSTSGAAPALAVRLRQQIAEITNGYGSVLELLAGMRQQIKDGFATFEERRAMWYEIVDSPAIENARGGDHEGAAAAITQLIRDRAEKAQPVETDAVIRAESRIRETLTWARNPVVTVSGQLGGLVLVDMVRRVLPSIEVAYVDTGYQPPESLEFIHEVAERWNLNLTVTRPDTDVASHEDTLGQMYLTDPAQCCALRKVAPAAAAIAGHDVWLSAVRRDQAVTRTEETVLAGHVLADDTTVWKLNPMVDWTWDDIDAYAPDRDVPRHPLYEQGYTSIGCTPCTTPTYGNGDDRSGRWKASDQIECGLHISRSRQPRP